MEKPQILPDFRDAFASRTMRLIRESGRLPFSLTGINSTVMPPVVVVERLRVDAVLDLVLRAGIVFIVRHDYQPGRESQADVGAFSARSFSNIRTACTPKVNADAKPGQWNRFFITLKADRCTVVLNGKTIIDNAQLPGIASEGPIALQYHHDEIEFANVFIKELP